MRLDRAEPSEIAAHLSARHRLVKAATGRRPALRKALPRQQQPDGIRLAYYRELRDAMRAARDAVHATLFAEGPALFEQLQRQRGDGLHADADDIHDRLLRLVRRAADAVAGRFSTSRIGAVARAVGKRTADFQKAQFGRQARAALGVDVVRSEPWLQPRIEAFTAENVSLIKSTSDRYFSDIEKTVLRGVNSGARWESIAGELEERYGIAERHAKLIARDQVGKFYGALNETRQKDLGLHQYLWRGMNDNRERPEHLAREGQRFAWTEPPGDGNPGQAVNCRCYAEPDFAPILESL